ncbi:MAG: hypothetical protein HOO06_09615 [Bdellovibrionaceae bacterium]|jgi:DNA segregation ATPase FtsK/SpoIIIE, S-DNA-T family|nr:hypothetical protein [Pseudobdellovibrionaceae bacterium]
MSISTGKYPNNKDQFKNKNTNKPDAFGEAINEFLQESIMVSAMGTWALIKSIFSRYCPLTLVSIAASVYAGYWIASEAHHIRFLHELEPNYLTYKLLMPMYKIHRNYYWAGISSLLYFPVLIMVGLHVRSVRTKFQALFYKIGLQNGVGDTPKLIKKKRIDKYRINYIFDANGIGLSEFETKRERLESHFHQNVESIKYGKHKGRIELSLNKQDFPEKLTYLEVAKRNPLPANSFFIGHSMNGVLTQNLAELPHILIAGATGSGKSVFFKQALVGLLESTPNIQMYLIDLKSGLEMIDFVKAPNVKVVKTMEEALKLLRQVEREMKSRFKYLEKSGRKQIVPSVDRKERIVVAVDEASELYMNRSSYDPDRANAIEARKLADSIAKLSRAAAIHLMLATQKLEKQVIPTSVTENISGRMVFKANSFQGSNQMIGSKDAMMLPEIPGRGIWSYGTKKLTIQAPYIDEKIIKAKCIEIAKDFEIGRRKNFNPMIGAVERKRATGSQSIAYSDLENSKTEKNKGNRK